MPVIDNVNTFDTLLTVVTDTNALYTDSSRITGTEDHAVGFMEDPEFGNTSAAIYFALRPLTYGANPFTNKDSINDRIDSVVLSLSYTGLYGDSLSVENLKVLEIDPASGFKDSLGGYPVTAPYFSTLSQPLATATVNFSTLDDSKQFRQGNDTALTTQANVLRIKLDKSLGLRLAKYDTTAAYLNDSLFATKFRGLALIADSNTSARKKALAYFSLADTSKTKLTVYYRTTTNGATDTAYTNFYFNSSSSASNANLVRRNIAGSNYQKNMPAGGQQKVYIQSGPGSYSTIDVPALATLSNRLVYKAELLMPVLPSAENNYFTAPILFLDQSDPANNRFITIQNDFLVDNSGNYNYTNFGGIISGDSAYIFNVSRYVQNVVSRRLTVHKMRVYAPFQTQPYYASSNVYPATYSLLTYSFLINSHIARGRVVLGGGSHPTRRMKLHVIYSRI